MIIAAKTGEGKTLCFALPILNSILNNMEKDEQGNYESLENVHGLILSPTRELAI
jgi:ATP-dependent RNA helicase DDX24/MAK5